MELLTTGQVARLLDLTPQRVVQLAAEGQLREVARVGLDGTRLFLRADVERLLAERQRVKVKVLV